MGPHQELIMAESCDHGRGFDGNGTLPLANREQTQSIVSLFAFMFNCIMIIIKHIIV